VLAAPAQAPTVPVYGSATGAARGGYTLADGPAGPGQVRSGLGSAGGDPDVILVATGSEVQIALDARDLLLTEGLAVRVVSMPCREWFAGQSADYQDSVLPPTVRARVSVEAAVGQGWRDVVGDAGRIVSLEHFGASADYQTLYREFGITPDAVARAARDSLAAAAGTPRPGGTQPSSAPTTGGTGDKPE